MSGSRRSSAPAALLACLFVAALVSSAVFAGVAPVAADEDPAGETALTQTVEADRVEFRVTVFANGSAEWLFRYERQLEDDTERQDFEAFAEEFNNQETDLYLNFQDRAEALTASGANATGRDMSAEAFGREAYIEERGIDASREFGVVEMSFHWTAFAAGENGRLVVGDVFDGGLYVGPDQAVVFRTGPDLQFQEIQPEDGDLSAGTLAESDTVTWEGERSFTDNRPRVVFAEAGTDVTPTETETETATATPVGTNPGWLLPLAALVAVLMLGVGAAVAYRSGVLPRSDGGTAAESSDGEADGGAGAGVAGAASAEPESEAESGSEADAAAGAAVSEEDLMSDEERVVSLLEDHGGRMKQVNIVDETGWSKSKVSMLLSDMEEEGTISKLRVGRENIVSLSGHEPDAAGSPFEDDS